MPLYGNKVLFKTVLIINIYRMNQEFILQEDKNYVAPDLEVMEIEIEQNILTNSSDLPDFSDEVW
jgi:hypothetical protein